MTKNSQSQKLFNRALQTIPGGVNSPVRAFKNVGGSPLFMQRADGAYMYDVDGNRYIDFIGSWGPMVAGHNHPEIREAIIEAAQLGISFGAPTELEIIMAERVCERVPSIEQLRMVNSGTEATMSAIRLARGFTGRDKIVKFEGCYHGHADSLLIKAGSGALTNGVPTSPGVPAELAKHTLTLPYNDAEALKACFAEHGEQIACLITEPVAGNMNCVLPQTGSLALMRELCDNSGALLIFDEVMTGFRLSLAGAQGVYPVKPDLTTLGKIIGAGMPVGAFGGRKDIMQTLSPVGPVYQAGTLSGNPMAMTAGLKMLEIIARPGFYQSLASKTETMALGMNAIAEECGIPFTGNHICGMFGFFFTDAPKVTSFSQVMDSNIERFKAFFHGMLAQGVYFAPAHFETGFMSNAHSDADLDQCLSATRKVMQSL